jgi:hypothetical protein
MPSRSLNISLLDEVFAVCRLSPGAPIPDWALRDNFFSVTRTGEELSIACEEGNVPDGITASRSWRGWKVAGPFDFSQTGVIAAVVQPLADAGISVFVLATYDTDYIFVHQERLEQSRQVLLACGHTILPL